MDKLRRKIMISEKRALKLLAGFALFRVSCGEKGLMDAVDEYAKDTENKLTQKEKEKFVWSIQEYWRVARGVEWFGTQKEVACIVDLMQQ